MVDKNKQIKTLLLIVVFTIVIALYFAFDLQKFLTLEYLKSSKAFFISSYEKYPILVMACYFIFYIVMTAFSIPGAILLTLAGGLLFGLFVGTVIVSFASTIGATLSMLFARFLLREWVQRRFASQMKSINSGINKDGGYYLFTLRLVPVVPFFVINLGMGLTRLRTITFYLVSQLGMLPVTLVYINAGSEIAKIESLGGILSTTLIGSFAFLGIFPLLVKNMLAFIEKRRRKND